MFYYDPQLLYIISSLESNVFFFFLKGSTDFTVGKSFCIQGVRVVISLNTWINFLLFCSISETSRTTGVFGNCDDI